MKVSKPVTAIDDSELIITIAYEKTHEYPSTVYSEDELPYKFKELIKAVKRNNE